MKTHKTTTNPAVAPIKYGTIVATVAACRRIPATFNPFRKRPKVTAKPTTN